MIIKYRRIQNHYLPWSVDKPWNCSFSYRPLALDGLSVYPRLLDLHVYVYLLITYLLRTHLPLSCLLELQASLFFFFYIFRWSCTKYQPLWLKLWRRFCTATCIWASTCIKWSGDNINGTIEEYWIPQVDIRNLDWFGMGFCYFFNIWRRFREDTRYQASYIFVFGNICARVSKII